MNKRVKAELERNIELYGDAPIVTVCGSVFDTAIKGTAVVVDDYGRATEHWLCDLTALIAVRGVAELRH